jgi:RimJ/RimL family protein N-acetyltransferase
MELVMRDVSITDSALLLGWRNGADVQKVSRQKGHLSIREHSEWLSTRISLIPNEPFLIFETEILKVGIVRFDFDLVLKHFEVSITVNPLLRGKGYGKRILKLAIDNCITKHPGTDFYAEVHKNNSASRVLFLKCGFKELEPRGEFLVFKRITNSN